MMDRKFDLPRQWQSAKKAALKLPANMISENIFLQAYQQMLESGQTRPYDDVRSTDDDPYRALNSLINWFDRLTADQATDFRHGWCYNREKLPAGMPHQARWEEYTNLYHQPEPAPINLKLMLDTFETQVKRRPVAFPAPAATKTLYHAVKTAQAIRPYLDGSKILTHPLDRDHMQEIFVQIVNMMGFIGACTGLSEQMREDLKSEIIAPTVTAKPFTTEIDQMLRYSLVVVYKMPAETAKPEAKAKAPPFKKKF